MSYEYYLDVLQNKYADFDGRARRSEYWFFQLFNLIAIFALAMLAAMFRSDYGFIIVFIYILGIIVPYFAVITRRLHDVGKSGWFYFVSFIPVIGPIWMLVLYCTDSEPGENIYGPNPKGIGNTHTDDDVIKSIGATE